MPLVLDGTTGFSLPLGAEIGIGTTTPAGNGLHVDHTAGATLRLTRLGTSTSHYVQLETDGTDGHLHSEGNFEIDVVGYISLDADDGGHIRFKDGGAEYFSIYEDASNNPILQASIADTNILFKGTDTGAGVITALDLDIANSGFAFFNANAYFNESGVDTDFRIKGTSVTNMFYADASTNRVILGYNSGRVPVNVLVPHVNSSITPAMRISTYGAGGYSPSNSSNAGARLEFGQYDDAYDWVTGSITSVRTGGSWGGDLTFYTNNNSASNNQTEHMRITSDGVVGIGTTSDLNQKVLIYQDTADAYSTSGYNDKSTLTLKSPDGVNNYTGIRLTNSTGIYEWMIGTNQTATGSGSGAADFVFQGYDRGNSTYKEYIRIEDSGNVGIGTSGATSSGYDAGSKKLSIMSTTLNNATSGYLELSSRANTNGYNAGAIQFNNFENANTAGTGTQNRTVGQIRTVITTTDSNAGDDSGGTMQFWTKPEAQALANTMRISTADPNHRADVTVDATGLAGDSGTHANAFFNAKAKGNYYAGTRIHSNSGHVGGYVGHWNGSSTARQLQMMVGGNGINSSDYVAVRADYLGRVTHPNRPHFKVRGFNSHLFVNTIQSSNHSRLRDWKVVDTNRGSHFDNSTGKFTCPIAGDYMFYCNVMFTNPNTMDFHLGFSYNDAAHTYSNDHNAGGGSNGHQWNGTTLTVAGYFASGDYVGFGVYGGGSITTTYLYGSTNYCIMGGYLL